MSAFEVFFGWPDGGVWSNFIDDLVVFTVGAILGRRSLKKLHAKLDRHHHEHMTAIADAQTPAGDPDGC